MKARHIFLKVTVLEDFLGVCCVEVLGVIVGDRDEDRQSISRYFELNVRSQS